MNSHVKLNFEICNPLESQFHLNRRKLVVNQFGGVHKKTKQNVHLKYRSTNTLNNRKIYCFIDGIKERIYFTVKFWELLVIFRETLRLDFSNILLTGEFHDFVHEETFICWKLATFHFLHG